MKWKANRIVQIYSENNESTIFYDVLNDKYYKTSQNNTYSERYVVALIIISALTRGLLEQCESVWKSILLNNSIVMFIFPVLSLCIGIVSWNYYAIYFPKKLIENSKIVNIVDVELYLKKNWEFFKKQLYIVFGLSLTTFIILTWYFWGESLIAALLCMLMGYIDGCCIGLIKPILRYRLYKNIFKRT